MSKLPTSGGQFERSKNGGLKQTEKPTQPKVAGKPAKPAPAPEANDKGEGK